MCPQDVFSHRFSATRTLALIADAWRNAYAATVANPLRASLSVASVSVGVTLLVTSIGLVRAIRIGVGNDLGSAAPLAFYVFREPVRNPECSLDEGECPTQHNPPLTLREAEVLRSLNSVHDIVVHTSWADSISTGVDEREGVTVDGYGARWLETNGNRVTEGRDFTDIEQRFATPVVILSTNVARQIFGRSHPIGANVRLGGSVLRVIGVYSPITSVEESISGLPADASVVVPIEVAKRRLGMDLSSLNFIIRPKEGVDQSFAQQLVSSRLRTMRRLRAGEVSSFSIVTQSQLLELYDGVSTGFHVMIFVLGLCCLAVGGVGILTVMTISVTERTPEIGLRMALGATCSALLLQFLAEAFMISAAGTLAGVTTSIAILFGLAEKYGLSNTVSGPVVLGGAVFGTVIGGSFGFAPAFRASQMRPLDALHHL